MLGDPILHFGRDHGIEHPRNQAVAFHASEVCVRTWGETSDTAFCSSPERSGAGERTCRIGMRHLSESSSMTSSLL